MNRWYLFVEQESTVLQFALSEFKRLLHEMDRTAEIVPADSPADSTLILAVRAQRFEGIDPAWDDGYHIHIRNCEGYIEASNERSVLLGVYRFFSEAGCVFSRPGRLGELIPTKDSRALRIDVEELAAYRHRGLCIEGSNSFENVVEMIDYLPKIGCNSYFIQFFVPYEFFDRWYRHEDNPLYTPTPIGKKSVECFLNDYREMLQMRGMICHGVGHGWTARVLGLPADGWYSLSNESIPSQSRNFPALIDGKRLLFSGSSEKAEGVPLNTSLCYSNPDVRNKLAAEITAYCLEHPELQYVHLWLADGNNNQCECPDCQKALPSDFYIEILNQVDLALSLHQCSTRLVFLIYQDLLWPPMKARLKNPDRFTLMFAPISRTYTTNYGQASSGKTVPYRRNQTALPQSVDDSLAYLEAWKQVFSGDAFLYDYHYMWDHYYDIGNCSIAHTLCEDIKALRLWGLNGFISCQVTRCQMPTGWGLFALGHCLWSGSKFDEKRAKEAYFKASFGSDWMLVLDYLEALSDCSCPEYCRGENAISGKEILGKLSRIPMLAQSIRPVISKHLTCGLAEENESWRLLWMHTFLAEAQANYLFACASQAVQDIPHKKEQFFSLIQKLETLCPSAMESREYIHTFNTFFSGDPCINSSQR